MAEEKLKAKKGGRDTNKLTNDQIQERRGMVKIKAINTQDKKNHQKAGQVTWVGKNTAKVLIDKKFAELAK